MTILGYDCDSRPLRAGDLVEIVSTAETKSRYRGTICTIVGIEEDRRNWLETDETCLDLMTNGGLKVCGDAKLLRRIGGDFTPCGQTFEELVDSLKRGIAA